jgi:hypothetical protein
MAHPVYLRISTQKLEFEQKSRNLSRRRFRTQSQGVAVKADGIFRGRNSGLPDGIFSNRISQFGKIL